MLLTAVASSCALMSQLFPERPPGVSNAAIRVGGAEALAAGVAMRDYMRFEAENTRAAGGLAPDGGVLLSAAPDSGWRAEWAPFHQCANSASTYEVWLELDAGARRWSAVVFPSGKCHENAYGGGADYEIDANTYEILNRVLGE